MPISGTPQHPDDGFFLSWPLPQSFLSSRVECCVEFSSSEREALRRGFFSAEQNNSVRRKQKGFRNKRASSFSSFSSSSSFSPPSSSSFFSPLPLASPQLFPPPHSSDSFIVLVTEPRTRGEDLAGRCLSLRDISVPVTLPLSLPPPI